MKKTIKQAMNHSLYRNAMWLIINSVVLSGFGFLFWTIVIRLYSVRQVGIATTLVSSLELISNLSLIGFNIALIRYLPRSREKDKMVSTCFLLSALIAACLSAFYVLGLNIFSPKLIFLKETNIYGLMFAIFVVGYALFTLTDAVFIGFRKAKFVLMKNIIFSLLKLIFPFILIFLGAFGIFSSMATSALIAFVVSIFFMHIRLRFIINTNIVKRMFRFSFGNYISNTLQYAPALVLPLIITNLINPETTAYFYVALMIASLIFIIPTAVSQSLLAEGSHNKKNLKVKKAFMFSYILIIPSVIFIVLFGKHLLLLFGAEYSSNAYRLLQILAISAIPFAVNAIYISVKNVEHKVKTVVLINFIITATILTTSYFLLRFELIGIGIAWLTGQLIANCYVLIDKIR